MVDTYYCQHGLGTGANDGSSWEDAFQSLISAIQSGMAAEDILLVKTHAGITLTEEIDIAAGQYDIAIHGGFTATLTGTDGEIGTDQTGVTVVDGDGSYIFLDVKAEGGYVTVSKFTATNCDQYGIYVDMGGGADDVFNATDVIIDGNHGDVRGLYLKDGAYNLTDVEVYDCDRGGIYQNNGATVGVGLVVHDNTTATNHGGGVHVNDGTFTADASSAIYNNEVTYGSGLGGGIYAGSGVDDITLNGTPVYGNTTVSTGGGIYWQPSSSSVLTLTGCPIYDNDAGSNGGGIYANGGSQILTRCTIRDNTAGAVAGGAWLYSVSGTVGKVINCVISGNESVGAGAAIYAIANHDLYVVNCDIVDNESTGTNYGGIYNTSSSDLFLFNSIVWGNLGSGDDVQIYDSNVDYYDLNYCDIQYLETVGVELGGTRSAGSHCFDDDPQFYGAGAHPYQLGAQSECVDAASITAQYYPATDFRGMSRIGSPDVGAYEYGHLDTDFTGNQLSPPWNTDDYSQLMLDLLPDGVIWDDRHFSVSETYQGVIDGGVVWQNTVDSATEYQNTIDGTADGDLLSRILYVIALERERLGTQAWKILNQSDPGVATDLLPDWQRVLGLPESCFAEVERSVYEQQQHAHAKRFSTGATTTLDWYIIYAASLGFEITVEENPVDTAPCICGVAICGVSRCGGIGGYSNLTVTIHTADSDTSILECALNKEKQAHIRITYVDAT